MNFMNTTPVLSLSLKSSLKCNCTQQWIREERDTTTKEELYTFTQSGHPGQHYFGESCMCVCASILKFRVCIVS